MSRSSTALLGILVLLGAACGSSAETATDTAAGSEAETAPAADATSTDDTSADGSSTEDGSTDEPAAAAESLGTCESSAEGVDEFVTVDFVAPADGVNDYWVVVAEPDGSNDATFQFRGIEAGATVAITEKIVGAPATCTVISVDPSTADTSAFGDVTACSVIEPDPALPDRVRIALDITNGGDGEASYVTVSNLIGADGSLVAQVPANHSDKLAAGAAGIAEGTTGVVDNTASYTCQVAYVWRQG